MREELYHPLLAHFPIVLFVLALFFKGLEIIFYKHIDLSEKMNSFCRIVLFAAPFFYLVTMYLGDSALDIIKKDFCNLKSIYEHEEVAKTALFFIVPALILEGLSKIEALKKKWKLHLSLLILALLLMSNGFIFKAAHSGAMLVYENGAAVRGAQSSCR